MTQTEITFVSEGVKASAWHFAASSSALDGPNGRPIVVMGHGFGGTKDSGLQDFADRFCAAGIDVLAIDFRGFGSSAGHPRQSISVRRQVADYEAAVEVCATLPGVDPHRIALWGSSLSGGHVIRVAGGRSDICAVIALTPLTNGLVASVAAAKSRGVASCITAFASAIASKFAQIRGRDPVMVPLVSAPGGRGLLSLTGAYESYTSMAGPTWRNEVDAAVGFEVGNIRTGKAARQMKSRFLVQIADFDRYVPAQSVVEVARWGRAEVHHYPCDHFDVWPGHAWFERTADDQVRFLTRAFALPSVGSISSH